jgi:hypothetical protein
MDFAIGNRTEVFVRLEIVVNVEDVSDIRFVWVCGLMAVKK